MFLQQYLISQSVQTHMLLHLDWAVSHSFGNSTAMTQQVIPPPQKKNKIQAEQTEEAVTISQKLNNRVMVLVTHSKDILEGGDSPSLSKSLVFTSEKGKLYLRYWINNRMTLKVEPVRAQPATSHSYKKFCSVSLSQQMSDPYHPTSKSQINLVSSNRPG